MPDENFYSAKASFLPGTTLERERASGFRSGLGSENWPQFQKADKILFKNGTIIDPKRKKQSQKDVLVVEGKIQEVGKIDTAGFRGEIVNVEGMVICPGLIDMHVHLREPGREDEETLMSGAAAAMAGGFTAVCPMPNTEPPTDHREVIQYIKEKFKGHLVQVYPIAATTKGRKGLELSEMAELVEAGAVAFSDDGSPITNTNLFRRALEYATMLGVPIIEHCEDLALSGDGVMHEGFVSTNLGLPGIPAISEEVMVARNLMVAEFTKGKLHIAHVSTAGSVARIREAKAKGVRVSCEVTPHHFTLTDEAVSTFDTNTKMNPPLRTREDVEALKEALRDGTIDVIASDHAPHAIEEKEVEYAAAPFGIIGLETMVGLVITQLVDKGVLSLSEAIAKMSIHPAEILALESPSLIPGARANLTILNPNQTWTVDKNKFKSRSRNSPFHGWQLKGKIFGVLNNT
ncbi:MAG: dihydroorotase, partial [candidate division KSB1 bacterium]|nr:dihydroorotase [candidate division KSB1 bacterium]